MRAYIDFEEDTVHKNDRAYICKTPATTGQPDDGFDFVRMDPKPYYIEYPEEQMEDQTQAIPVRVNITGLDAEAVADIIIILRDEGYKAVLEMDPKFTIQPNPQPVYPYVTNGKWYNDPVAPPVTNIYGSFNTE